MIRMQAPTADGAVCSLTGKRRLGRAEARREAAWWRRTRLARMAAYRCGSCRTWHVTPRAER